jgi:hypothetical protein
MGYKPKHSIIGLAQFYNSFCSPGVNFLSGFHQLLQKKNIYGDLEGVTLDTVNI